MTVAATTSRAVWHIGGAGRNCGPVVFGVVSAVGGRRVTGRPGPAAGSGHPRWRTWSGGARAAVPDGPGATPVDLPVGSDATVRTASGVRFATGTFGSCLSSLSYPCGPSWSLRLSVPRRLGGRRRTGAAGWAPSVVATAPRWRAGFHGRRRAARAAGGPGCGDRPVAMAGGVGRRRREHWEPRGGWCRGHDRSPRGAGRRGVSPPRPGPRMRAVTRARRPESPNVSGLSFCFGRTCATRVRR